MPEARPPGAMRPGEAVADLLGIEGDLGAPVTAVLALGQGFAITTGDGRIAFVAGEFEAAEVVQAHGGAILSAAVCGDGTLTGGDDGRVVLAARGGAVQEVWRSATKWVDHVASRGADGKAWACGKSVFLAVMENPPVDLAHPSAIGGLAFASKSNRLAVAHYGGVTVWDLARRPPAKRVLEWKGSHLDIAWSRDERFVLTAMQEGALHGWRVSDGADFQMSGYAAKPRSLSWSRKGDWLATSGAAEVLLWSFKNKAGPMGTFPDALTQRHVPVARVAFHPINLYVAAGYQDGALLLARQEDRRELLVRHPQGSPISGLAWSQDARRLAYGTEDGRAGLVDFSAFEAPRGRHP